MHLSTLFLFFFSLTHATWTLGVGHALILLGLIFGGSLLFEVVGVVTGWIYGSFRYSGQLGPKLFNLVPMIIPIAWFMMAYPSLVLAKTLTKKSSGRPTIHAIGLALLSAIVLTAWDLGMDPIMVNTGHWAWEAKGWFYGVPLQNFLGWLFTAFSFYLPYLLIASRFLPHPMGAHTRAFKALPIIAYAQMGLNTAVFNLVLGQLGAAVLSSLTMGGFATAALLRIWYGDSTFAKK